MIIFRKLELKSPKYKFNLDINGSKILLSGNSGSGKSLLVEMIRNALHDPLSNLYNKKLIIYSDGMSLTNISNTLIVIDNYDSLIIKHPEVTELIEADTCNQYLIMSRTSKGLSIPTFNCGKIIFNKTTNEYNIEYYSPKIRERVVW